MYQKYLVTGAKNPVGRLIVQMLLAEGCEVRVLVPPESDSSLLSGMGAEVFEGEIFNKDSLKAFLAVDNPRQCAVIHAEEILSISEKKNLDMRRVNVAGTINLVDMSIRAKIGRFAYLGSAYSLNPNTAFDGEHINFDRNNVEGDYAITKAEAAAYIMEKVSLNKFNATLLLPTFIIGPGFPEDYDMNKIIKKYTENKVHTISGGHSFVDVRDVAAALVGICENGVSGGAYVLNGEYKSSKEFFETISKTSGVDEVKEIPKWAQKKSMAKLVDTFYRVTKKDNPKEVYALFMNNPSANFESTVDGTIFMEDLRKVSESIEDALKRPGNEVLPDRIPVKHTSEEENKAEDEASEEKKEPAIVVPKLGVTAEEKTEDNKEEAKDEVVDIKDESEHETDENSTDENAKDENSTDEISEDTTVTEEPIEEITKSEAEPEEDEKTEEPAEEPSEESTEESVVEDENTSEEESEEVATSVEPAAKPIWETTALDVNNLDEDEFFKDLM